MNSKRKGNAGERELAGLLREHGYDCRRGQQYNGADGSADVIGLPGVHLEIKRTEAFRMYDAVEQATRDAGGKALPVVMTRRNHSPWLVVMRLDDWIELYNEWR